MSKIQIETLTPVHIGSGTLLQYNTDFVTVRADGKENKRIRIIDDRKIMNLIGHEHLNDWVLSIERKENTKDLVKRFAPESKVADYSKRRINNYADEIKSTDTLKECIHNGLGYAYIPGSSIKGAIRTAILSVLYNKVENAEQKIRTGKLNRNNNPFLKADKIEKELFGENVNEDLFRFLIVGDATFCEDVEICTRMVNINIREKQDFEDTSKPQLIEAIGNQENAEFQMKIKSDEYNWVKNNKSPKFNLKNLEIEMSSLPSLFQTINAHTIYLLESEKDFWNDYNQQEVVEDYISKIEELIEVANQCIAGKSCVIRIGHGSGWRFITGGWSEKLTTFENEVVNASRPNNQRYEHLPFPKTRRVDEDLDILGFVKLTIKD